MDSPIASHPSATFGGHTHCSRGDITFLGVEDQGFSKAHGIKAQVMRISPILVTHVLGNNNKIYTKKNVPVRLKPALGRKKGKSKNG